MTEAPAPEGGWAETPRPPITVVLTDEHVRRLTSEAVRSTQVLPLVLRLVVSVVLAALLAATWAPWVGALAGVALATLAARLFVIRRRAIEASVAAGSARTTGYDHDGRFALAGAGITCVAPGSARSVRRRDGLAVVRPTRRRGRPVVLLDELLTPADEAVLTTTPA